MAETLVATRTLVADDFDVMVYCADDPIAAKKLEDLGACAIMPLGSLIGSGLGIQNPVTIRMIVESAGVPVLVDAGVGTASDAAAAMELGCAGVLMNTAIAEAKRPRADGARHAPGGRKRPTGVSRGANGAAALRRSEQSPGGVDLAEEFERTAVGHAVEIGGERRGERGGVVSGLCEQCHRRVELEIVGMAENFMRRSPGVRQHRGGTFEQAAPEQRMFENRRAPRPATGWRNAATSRCRQGPRAAGK